MKKLDLPFPLLPIPVLINSDLEVTGASLSRKKVNRDLMDPLKKWKKV